MSQKNSAPVTQWFDGRLKPHRVGTFQRLAFGYIVNRRFDGIHWRTSRGDISEIQDGYMWRGLAEKPAGAA